jgi:hypothetical protein
MGQVVPKRRYNAILRYVTPQKNEDLTHIAEEVCNLTYIAFDSGFRHVGIKQNTLGQSHGVARNI